MMLSRVLYCLTLITAIKSVLVQERLQTNALSPLSNSGGFFQRPNETYHDMETACAVTRRMIGNQTISMVNTKQVHATEGLVPMSFPEYAIDCFHTGHPVLLLIEMSHNWRNIAAAGGNACSLTYLADESADWPGAVYTSMYGLPRVNLNGYFQRLVPTQERGQGTQSELHHVRYVDPGELAQIEQCFREKHPESGSWFPGEANHVHRSLWTEFVVTDGYFVGGFGGYAYIGDVTGCW